jgi:hypothetical protein
MRRSVVTLVFLVAAVSASALAVENPSKEGGAPIKPKLELSVSTFNGYIPLALKITGAIKDVDVASIEKCEISVEWQGEKVPGILRNSKDYLPCVADGKAALTSEIRREFVIEEPGTYSYRLVVTPKDGKPVASASREVKVVRTPLEMKVTGTTTN